MRTQRIPITFENGLLESFEESTLGQGFATELLNYEPTPQGGLRCRRGWAHGSIAGQHPTLVNEKRSRGITTFAFQRSFDTPARRQYVSNLWPTVSEPDSVGSGDLQQGSCSWPQPTVAGSTLIATVEFKSNQSNITPQAPGGWTLQRRNTLEGGGGVWVILCTYMRVNSASRSGAEQFSYVGDMNDAAYISLTEVTGLATGPLDVSAAATGFSTGPLTGVTPTTTQADEYVFAVMCWRAPTGQTESIPGGTLSNGFASIEQRTDSNRFTHVVGERVVNVTGTFSTGTTTATAVEWVGHVFTFKARQRTSAGGHLVAALSSDESAQFYELYRIDRDAVSSGSWSLIGNITGVENSRPLAFASGASRLLVNHPAASTIRMWDGASFTSVASTPEGRALTFHKNRFFSAGTNDTPTRLWWSDIGSATSWPSNNWLEVGQEDGEPIEDIAPAYDGLLIAKRNSVWYATGTFVGTDFNLERLEGGGAAPGRSICPTPYGAIVAGWDSIWLFTGGPLQDIGEAIETSYHLSGNFVSTAFLNRRVYICDQGNQAMWVYDFNQETWFKEWMVSYSDSPGSIYTYNDMLLSSPKGGANAPFISYRRVPAGTRFRDVGQGGLYRADTPEFFFNINGPITPKYLYVQIRQRGGDASEDPMEVYPYYDGVEQDVRWITPQDTQGTYRYRIDVFGDRVWSVKFAFIHNVGGASDDIMDIERVEFEFDQMEAQ